MARQELLDTDTYNTTRHKVNQMTGEIYPRIETLEGAPVKALNDLTDVIITAPGSGHVLRHNGTNWENVLSDARSIFFPVRAATMAPLSAYTHATGVLTASANGALPAQDGIALALNDRLLVKDEAGASAPFNGIYFVSDLGSATTPWKLTRAADADMSDEIVPGRIVSISEGGVHGNELWAVDNTTKPTLGTTAISFVKAAGGGGGAGNAMWDPVRAATTGPIGRAARATSEGASMSGMVTYISKKLGAIGNDTSFEQVDPGTANVALLVSVAGAHITVRLATDAAGAVSSTSEHVANAVNAHAEASALVTAQAGGSGWVAMASPLEYLTGGADVDGAAPNVVDGVTLALDDRILVKDLDNPARNGIYKVSVVGSGNSGTWVRAEDADLSAELYPGKLVAVSEGTANGNGLWILDNAAIPTLGTTAITFASLSNAPTQRELVDVYTVASEAEQLALVVQEGDMAIRSDLARSYVHNGGTAGTMADWSQLLFPQEAPKNLDWLTDVTLTTPTTGQVLKFNGTEWVNAADETGGGGGGGGGGGTAAFVRAAKDPAAVAQTLDTADTWTKVVYGLEHQDASGWFDPATSRMTPKLDVPGSIVVTAATFAEGPSGASIYMAIFKNGVEYDRIDFRTIGSVSGNPSAQAQLNGAAIVDVNGTTDYIEIFLYRAGGTAGSISLLNNAGHSYFHGQKPGGGGVSLKHMSLGNDPTPLLSSAATLYFGRQFTPSVPGLEIIGGVIRDTVNGANYTIYLRRVSDLLLVASKTVVGTGGPVKVAFDAPAAVVAGTAYEFAYSSNLDTNLWYHDAAYTVESPDALMGTSVYSTAADGATARTLTTTLQPNARVDYREV